VSHICLKWAFVVKSIVVSSGFVSFKTIETAWWTVTFDCLVIVAANAFESVFIIYMVIFAAYSAFLICIRELTLVYIMVQSIASHALVERGGLVYRLDSDSFANHGIASIGHLNGSILCWIYKNEG
jgi:hypothetical protein